MLPASLPRFVQLPGDEVRFVSLESVVRCFTKQIFPDYQLVGDGAFRIIRDSDIEVEEEARSEEDTSELQSLNRITYAVFCLKKKTHNSIQQYVNSM